MPPLAVATASTLVYSYATSSVQQLHYHYSAALALVMIPSIPSTFLVMMPTVRGVYMTRSSGMVNLCKRMS
ncbi:hypothetical protein V1522DRAFT_415430 [Lipomyces starkeyi]